MTKGAMIKALKQKGIRKADKESTGSTVKLEHLKTSQIVNLYIKHCLNE